MIARTIINFMVHVPIAVKVKHVSSGQIMVLKKNIKATGTKTMREVELLRKLSHPNIVQ